jgi:hypothetical protein
MKAFAEENIRGRRSKTKLALFRVENNIVTKLTCAYSRQVL